MPDASSGALCFRDPATGRGLREALVRAMRKLARPVTLMHVCGTHEQAIARFGLRSLLPAGLEVVMGPGCPVCVTDRAEVDEAVALARQGVAIATYGDVLRVTGSSHSLAHARAQGAEVHVVYGIAQAVELARRRAGELAFFATGFETTAVATAAALLADPPPNLSVLSAHKYIPPAMELVAALPGSRVDGFLAAGHAATITGWGIFEGFARRHGMPVVVAGFEPLDILAALARLVERLAEGRATVDNLYPRCVTREGNLRAQERLWRVFRQVDGTWRGIARIPGGDLRLTAAWAHVDARRRFGRGRDTPLAGAGSASFIDPPPYPSPRSGREMPLAGTGSASLTDASPDPLDACRCGEILTGQIRPTECPLFGGACTPDQPVGACMVSSEGTCRIWHEYGGRPEAGGPS
jgi:hydrogenase expression/formation protein HypD